MKKAFYHERLNFFTYITFQSDRKGTSNAGPKSWASSGDSSSGGGDEGSSLMTWIVPAVLAFAGSMVYRMYFAKS